MNLFKRYGKKQFNKITTDNYKWDLIKVVTLINTFNVRSLFKLII